MALPALQLANAPLPVGWLRIQDAAPRLGVSEGQLRRRCGEQLHAAGMAKKHAGSWIIARSADPRLAEFETAEMRDLRQVGELHREGYPAAAVQLAERKVGIVKGWYDFKPLARDDESARREFINHLAATGKLPAKGIHKLQPRTLRLWCDLYRRGGLRSLVRKQYAERECHAFGTKARDLFTHYMLTVPGQCATEALKLVSAHVADNGWGDDPEWAIPSVGHAQRWYKQNIPLPVKVHANEGPHKFAAKCLPKIARCLEDLPAGARLCGDESVADFMVRVPSREGWRSVRPKLTAWMDVRSRLMAGWVLSERANSDTILSSFRMACEQMETAPDEVTIDNGKDYRSAAGRTRRHRKWDEFDSGRILGAFERLSVKVHFAIVRQPWSKSIESRFRTVKDRLDRYFASFRGGSPDERPWDADKWTRTHIEQLPTMEEASDLVEQFFAALHDEPVSGDGMFNLSPRQALRQYYLPNPRPVSSDALKIICTRMAGPVKVGRDGVRHNNIQYGKFNEQIFLLQGKEVYLLADPVEADRVTICDKNGVPICIAFADRNLGQTADEVRAAEAARRRCRKIVKQYPQARDTVLQTPVQRISELRAIAAKARQVPDETLPPPPSRESVRLANPAVEVAAEKMKRAAGAETLRRLSGTNAAAKALNETRPISLAELNARSVPATVEGPPTRSVSLYELSKLTEAQSHEP